MALSSQAQTDSLSTLQVIQISKSSFPYILPSGYYPDSLSVSHPELGNLTDKFLIEDGVLSIKSDELLESNPATIFQVRFRVLGMDLTKAVGDLDSNVVQLADDEQLIGFDFIKDSEQESLVNMQGLNYQGSFTRGVSFGNSQNLVLNSAFNLRFEGIIGNDVEVQAAISDQNIPLQPEGNTEQLQEFDKIFIRLKKGSSSLIAGDYELKRPKGHFVNYFKKLQGASFSHESELGEKYDLKSSASAAISRGKFARNVIQPIEGNQGPYRLQGNDGERFLIILSGTEKVYIDGKLQVRGLANDYTIDYNRAEVIFSQSKLVTKDLRIIIEFEYSDQNYLRSIFTAGAELQSEKADFHFNFYSEQDAKNSGSIQELDSTELNALRLSGDNIDLAFVTGIDSLEEFNEFRVSYEQIDTLIPCEGTISILKYSTVPEKAVYSASFLDVGIGNGDYLLDESNLANGRVFYYVAPDEVSCEKRGRYIPAKRLIAPNQLQMFALGGTYQFSKNLSISNETSLSRLDMNRFSDLDKSDDVGLANRTDLNFEKILGKSDSSWVFGSDVYYEWVSENFNPLNPYRGAEFNRDWNLSINNSGSTADSLLIQKSAEHLPGAELYFRKKGFGKLGYQVNSLLRGEIYKGVQQNLIVNINQEHFSLDAVGRLLNSTGLSEKTRYEQPRLNVKKIMPGAAGLVVGFDGLREWNERREAGSDSLKVNSIGFNEYKFYVENSDNDSLKFRVGYGQRYDYLPIGNELSQTSFSDNFDVSGKWNVKNISRLNWIGQIRKLSVQNNELTDLVSKNSFLGRVEHNLNILKGGISNNLIYELGSGQEPLIEYRFLEVQAGEGVYFWDPITSDFNGDGVPQVDEIQEAAFSDQANIIRVSLITNEFTQTNNVRYNQSLRIDPKRIIRNAKSKLKFIKNFSWQSTLQINRKTKDDAEIQAYNPFISEIPDSSLVTINISNQHTLFYRPRGTKMDWRLGRATRNARNLLTTGFDQRTRDRWFTRLRWNLSQRWSFGFELEQEAEGRDMQFFDRQDYQVNVYRGEGEITYRPSKDFRIIGKGKYAQGDNAELLGGESFEQNSIELEGTYNKSTKTSIRFKITGSFIKFDGVANSPVELVLLEGLKNGQNYLWELSLNRSLTDNILLTLNYNGRKTGENRVIHLGSVQLGARF